MILQNYINYLNLFELWLSRMYRTSEVVSPWHEQSESDQGGLWVWPYFLLLTHHIHGKARAMNSVEGERHLSGYNGEVANSELKARQGTSCMPPKPLFPGCVWKSVLCRLTVSFGAFPRQLHLRSDSLCLKWSYRCTFMLWNLKPLFLSVKG